MAGRNIKDPKQVKIVKTICNMCINQCGIDVYVQDGKIVEVSGMQEHPLHHLCIKPYASAEVVHSKERLTTPLKRVNGAFKEISWDEAFTVIVDKLTRIKDEYGAKAVVPYVGIGVSLGVITKVIRRFADIYGTPNFKTGGWYCFRARVMGSVLTVGSYPNPDFLQDTKCMVIWGKNPPESLASERHAINVTAKRGAKLIVVDPRATPLAKQADVHAQVRPGTDCALALGLMNVIITEERYDKDFIEDWTIGFDKLVEMVKDYPPEKVEVITSVPAGTIRDIARMYATNRPACISMGVSLEHCSNGIQTIRAINILEAICGNLEISGGNLTFPGSGCANLRLPEKASKDTPVGAEFPLFTRMGGDATSTTVTDTLLNEKPYPIKSLLVVGANPLVNWPNSNKVREAFEKLEFLMVEDLFMTETAKMADIVLPAVSHLETDDLRDVYFNHECLPLIVKSNKVIEPIGQCMEDWKIWTELGRRMGYGEYFPWESADELIEDLLEPTDISLAQLKENPGGILYRKRTFHYYRRGGFKTPSKKVEIYSERMAQLGYDPLPTFHEPVESLVSRPDLAERYPFVLTTGPNTSAYTHSRYRNVPSLRRLCPEPFIEINTTTAQGLGIADGYMVKVSSPRGSVRAKARLTDGIHPNVVSMPHGWSNDTGANANCLTNK